MFVVLSVWFPLGQEVHSWWCTAASVSRGSHRVKTAKCRERR